MFDDMNVLVDGFMNYLDHELITYNLEEDMKNENKEIEELLNKMKKCYCVMDYYLAYNEVDLLLSYIESLEQENQLLKKQKNDAIQYIKKFYESPEYIDAYDITYWTNEVLRMLGEIDE